MPDTPPDFELHINGGIFAHFTRGWLRRELETVADSFEMTYADLRLNLNDPIPVRPGDECSLHLREKLLLTGFIDDTSVQYDAESLTLTMRGRSKTCDLVDCSVVRKPGRWRNATLKTIVRDICEPFSIDVEVEPLEDIDRPFTRFAIDPGETCADAIHRACTLRAAWATCTPEGGLLITRAGNGATVPLALEYGVNIISGERYDSWTDRYDQYLLKGQIPSDDDLSGRSASQLVDTVLDAGISRYRPLLLVSTGHDRKGDLKRRAQWERNRRAGSGERFVYRVDDFGWESSVYVDQFNQRRRDDFKLWEPNQEVRVRDPRLEAEDSYLVAAVSYRWDAEGDDGGRATDLTLTRKEAFTLQEFPPRKTSQHSGGWWYSHDNINAPGALPNPLRDNDELTRNEALLTALGLKGTP